MSEKPTGSEAMNLQTNGKHAGEPLQLSSEMIASHAQLLWQQRGCSDIDLETLFPEAEAPL